jgi:DNA repair exonuclease SbcCD ATPase subunit
LEAYRNELKQKVEQLRRKEKAELAEMERLAEIPRADRKAALKLDQEVNTLALDIRGLERDLDAAERERERIQHVRDEVQKALEEKTDLLNRRKVFEQYATIVEERIKFLESCLKVVSRDGLPAYLASLVGPQLNRAAAEYAELFGEGEINVEFALEDGELDVLVDNRHGGRALQDQSRGEMRVAALVASFAFRDVLARSNILILDEPGEGLDAGGAALFARGLAQLTERFPSIFLVTHNPFILGALEPDNHLQVVKQNRVAEVRRLK